MTASTATTAMITKQITKLNLLQGRTIDSNSTSDSAEGTTTLNAQRQLHQVQETNALLSSELSAALKEVQRLQRAQEEQVRMQTKSHISHEYAGIAIV